MKVSVLTPTIRKEGLDLVHEALKRQTFDDFEWLIGSPFDPELKSSWFPIDWVPDTFEGGFWTLNRIYNKLFSQARGDLIVTLQDWIYVTPDGLEMFWEDFEATDGNACISGVGDQYSELDALGKPSIKVWSDPRKHMKYGSFYECYFQDVEWNWAAIPKRAFFDVGGMDEKLDFLGYGGDQLQCCARMNDAGYRFYLNQLNESFTLRHGREDFGGQEKWDKNHVLFNGRYEQRKKELILKGEWPRLVDFGRKDVLEEEKGGIDNGKS